MTRWKAITFGLLLAAVLAVPVSAQSPTPVSASLTTASSDTTLDCPTTSCLRLPVRGYGSAAVQLTGTFTATVTFEVSVDGRNYQTVNATPSNSSTAATTATAPGVWSVNVGGMDYVRVRVSAYTSGTVTATLLPSAAGGGSGGGGGGSNAAASATGSAVPASASYTGVNVSGTLRGWTGLFVGTHYAPAVAIVDSSGNQISSFGGSGGTAQNDNTIVGQLTAGGALFDTTPPVITDGNVGLFRMSTDRYLYTIFPSAQAVTGSGNFTVVNAGTFAVQAAQSGTWTVQPGNTANTTPWLVTANAGTGTFTVDSELLAAAAAADNMANPTAGGVLTYNLCYDETGANWDRCRVATTTEATHDTALGTITSVVGNVPMLRASAAAPTDVSADGDAVIPWALRSGAQVFQPSFAGTLASTGNGVSGAGVQRVTLASDDPLVARRSGDPCTYGSKLFVAISQTASAQLIAGTASNRIYVCSITLTTATAQNIALVNGTQTTTVCDTGTAGMIGGTSAATGMQLAANGGFAFGTGAGTVAKSTADANNVCLLQSGTGQVSGTISYVVAAN